MHGSKTEYAKVKLITEGGFLLEINGKDYFASFEDFPYLYDLPVSEAYDVEYLGFGDIRWNKADIDLNVDILADPAKYPLVMNPVSKTAAALFGRKGGKIRSLRKAEAARANGSRGGRPRKVAKATDLVPA